MPFMSTASPQAIIAAWILQVAQSETEASSPSNTNATLTDTDDESSTWYASLSEGESDLEIHYAVAKSSDSDGPDTRPSEHEDDSHTGNELTGPSDDERGRAAQYLAGAEAPFVVKAGEVEALHVKPERRRNQMGDTADAWKKYTFMKQIVIRKNKAGGASGSVDSGSDLTQYSSDRESYVSEEIEATLEEEALYYASDSEGEDDQSKEIMAEKDEEESAAPQCTV
ncbi:hypothetical protein EWM64_g7303 [Hericium alpestre]|uniref:Uncharacterized protein n=1 Tax=Hericium alpestre TaxID=135208 RepID=A0A4Y9ZPK7_9AGAM|nr:hypothetical protein EWM64_g7303 [Hericium alpestre]